MIDRGKKRNVGTNTMIADYYQPDYTSVISNVVSTGVMLTCNIIYFKKRMHLFVNS